MKVEIDLQDILADEYGQSETLAESIHRQVVDRITETINKGVRSRVDEAVDRLLNAAIKDAVIPRMDELLAEILDAEFVPVDRYGTKGKKTTFREQLVETIRNECKIERDSYNRKPENAFTKAVDSCVADLAKKLESQFKEQVDADFSTRAVAMAKETFAKCLGIKN